MTETMSIYQMTRKKDRIENQRKLHPAKLTKKLIKKYKQTFGFENKKEYKLEIRA
jgi:hypothetical protein